MTYLRNNALIVPNTALIAIAKLAEFLLLPCENGTFNQRFPAENLIAGTRIEVLVIRTGERDAHARFVARLGDHSPLAPSPVEHLDARMTGDVIPALAVRGHSITAAVHTIRRTVQRHITLSGMDSSIGRHYVCPHIRAAVFRNDQEVLIR